MSVEALAQKHAGQPLKVCLISTVGGGTDEETTAAELGVATCKRYSCIDLPPEYAISIPHMTVIHRSGLVVRNGKVADLETLLPAMLAEPPDA